jgi:CheY-like chemotaxis protein
MPAEELETPKPLLAARRILVVDDDPAVHRVVSALFTPEGHVVEAVRSGAQGLRMLRERTFDLIVADALASVAPARLFVGALTTDRPEICDRLILGVSGNGEPPELGAHEQVRRLRKPFNLRDLHAVAAEVFANTPPRSPAATEAR